MKAATRGLLLDNLLKFIIFIKKIISVSEGEACALTSHRPEGSGGGDHNLMPTYGYKVVDPRKSCDYCRRGFEIIQRMTEAPLTICPRCRNAITRILFAPSVVIKGSPLSETDKKIKAYEKEGKWSHAAELADKEAEKTKRDDLKTRALENYKKAGYNFDKYEKES
jgi:putative FmdB family regulatory protein